MIEDILKRLRSAASGLRDRLLRKKDEMTALREFAKQFSFRVVDDDFGGEEIVLAGAIICGKGKRLNFCPTNYPRQWPRIKRRLEKAGLTLEMQDDYDEEWSFDPSDGLQVRILFETLGMLKALPGDSAPNPRDRQVAELSRPAEEEIGGPELRLSPGAARLADEWKRNHAIP